MIKIGQNIKEARKAKRLTQKDLGERCGWSDAQTRISNYETDFREPSLSDLSNIAENLGLSLSRLIDYRERESPPAFVREPTTLYSGSDDVTNSLMEIIAKGTAQEKKLLLDMFRTIKSQAPTDPPAKKSAGGLERKKQGLKK